MADCPENGCFVRFADVATGNSFIDGTNGFVNPCIGDLLWRLPLTTLAVSDFLCYTDFGTEFLAVGCLVLTSFGALLVVASGVVGVHEKGRFSTSCTVSVAHALVNGTGVGFPLLNVNIFLFVCEFVSYRQLELLAFEGLVPWVNVYVCAGVT